MVTYSSLPESGSLKTGSLAPWRKQTITPTTRGSADDSAERGVSTATAGANATTAPAARRRSIARARPRYGGGTRYPRELVERSREKQASKQAGNTQAGKQRYRQANLRKGQLNRHARESARSARSAPRPPLVHTKHRLAAAVASRAELALAVKRDTQGQTTFLYLHSFSFTTPQQEQSHTVLGWARRGTPPVSNFASVGSVFRPRSLRRHPRPRPDMLLLYVHTRDSLNGRCILRFLFLPY